MDTTMCQAVDERIVKFIRKHHVLTLATTNSQGKEEIQIAALTDKYGEDYEKKGFDPIDVAVVCYGIFDNAYCVVIWQDAIDHFKSTEVAVGEYTFEFPSNKVLRVYFEGKFYSLPEAYENGILDDAEIEELYNYYTKTRLGE